MPTNRVYRVAVIPGDGIGKEVVPEGVRDWRPRLRNSASSCGRIISISPRVIITRSTGA